MAHKSNRPDRRAFLKGLGTVGATALPRWCLPRPQPSHCSVRRPRAPPPRLRQDRRPMSFLCRRKSRLSRRRRSLDPSRRATPGGTRACGADPECRSDARRHQGDHRLGAAQDVDGLPDGALGPAPAGRLPRGHRGSQCLHPQDVPKGLRSAQRGAADSGSPGTRAEQDRARPRGGAGVLRSAAERGDGSFFADPIYGGNKNKVSWKMLGFPGVIAIYSGAHQDVSQQEHDVEPTSIADLS